METKQEHEEQNTETFIAPLTKLIGQKNAKATLGDSLRSLNYNKEGISALLLGEAGLGKSAVLNAYGKALESLGFLVKNYRSPSEFRLRGDEFNTLCAIIRGEIAPKWALLIDEAHLLTVKATVQLDAIRAFVMKALDGNNKGKHIPFGDGSVFFNKTQHVLMLATNHPRQLSPDDALRTRTFTIELEHYDSNEIMQILLMMLERSELRACESSLKIMVGTCRGTARPIERLVEALRIHCNARGKDTVNRADIIQCLHKVQFYPLGLNVGEIKILKSLQVEPMRRGEIAQSMPNIDSKTLDKSLYYMMSRKLITTHTRGYIAKQEGVAYLQAAAKEGFKI